MTKNRKAFILISLIILLILSAASIVSAANDKVDVYLFRGEGCSHCAQLEPYLNYLKDETYKGKINLHEYEIWYNEDNANLAQTFLDAYGEQDNGVPMTFIGTHYLSGYNESMQADFRAAIDDELANGPIDPMDIVNGKMTRGRIPADEVVTIYFFRGEGCSHCAEEEPFLDHLINDVYGNKIQVLDYEVWYNDANAEYAEKFHELKQVIRNFFFV